MTEIYMEAEQYGNVTHIMCISVGVSLYDTLHIESLVERIRDPKVRSLSSGSMMQRCSYYRFLMGVGMMMISLVSLTPTAGASVVLPEYNRSFQSLPASFGKRLRTDNSVSAYLQIVPNWPRLCQVEQPTRDPDPTDVVIPEDGRPVALLAERGLCTFWEKGNLASFWYPTVQYVIVYDKAFSGELVPMSGELETEMTLLFVTRDTGLRK